MFVKWSFREQTLALEMLRAEVARRVFPLKGCSSGAWNGLGTLRDTDCFGSRTIEALSSPVTGTGGASGSQLVRAIISHVAGTDPASICLQEAFP